MFTIDETEDILNEIAGELPEEFFRDLNGGIALKGASKRHPKSCADDLYILGEYRIAGPLGRYIAIYYGSVIRAYGNCSREEYKNHLRKILKHEFRHHLESLAGEKDLEIEDAIALEKYLKQWEKVENSDV